MRFLACDLFSISLLCGVAYDVFGNIHESGYLDGVMIYPKKRDAEASYSPAFHVVYMKKMTSKNAIKNLASDAAFQFEHGFWSDSSAEHTIRHELGHSVQHMLTDNNLEKLDKISEIRNNLMNKCGISEWSMSDTQVNMKKAGEYISYYALRNDGEMIAESIAEYMSDKPRETSIKVVNILLGLE